MKKDYVEREVRELMLVFRLESQGFCKVCTRRFFPKTCKHWRQYGVVGDGSLSRG